jgi:hypothetical protein
MQWLWEELRLSVSKQTMSKELRAMGFRKLSARPRHHADGKSMRGKQRMSKQSAVRAS